MNFYRPNLLPRGGGGEGWSRGRGERGEGGRGEGGKGRGEGMGRIKHGSYVVSCMMHEY